ncbi:MAG: hypothetical protein AAF688_08075 [Bacteroidota bacterium]
MQQLYKSRDFGALFQDTFAFLKANGGHLFKHFFIVNGLFLLVLSVLGYFFTKFYTDVMFGGILGGNTSGIDAYMNDNAFLFVILVLAFIIVALTAGVVSYSYLPIYLKLYDDNQGKNFSTKAIISAYKKNIGKILLFLVCGILIAIPVGICIGIISFILVITIIGTLALPLVIGFVALFYQMTLMEYINGKRGIWDCFGYSLSLIGKKFWVAITCVGLFYLMSYIVQNIMTLIPYIFGMASVFTSIESGGQPNTQEVGATMTVIMLAVFFISFIFGSMLNVITQLNQGIVFYSLKEENENINTKSIIDQIGSGE